MTRNAAGFVGRGMSRWLAALLALVIGGVMALGTPAAVAREGLVIGVLASRHADVMRQRFAPLAAHLGEVLNQPVRLQVFDQEAMELALHQHRLDLVVTNPSHYLVLRARNAMTGVLATLVTEEQGAELNALGGVVLVHAERTDLQRLSDLKGRLIASPGPKFLGGFQTQMLELTELGLRQQDMRWRWTGTHDAVVQAVVAREVDAGFIRTGELEQMIAAGLVKASDIRVLNPQNLYGFPFRLSTRLYPEWPVLALPHMDPHVVRRVASALLALEADHPAMVSAGLHAFSVPADYLPVENLARRLRLPPYDVAPVFTLGDVLSQYRTTAILVGGLMLALTGALSLLAIQRQRLKRALQRTELGDSVFRYAQEGIVITDPGGRIVDVNASFTRITGYTREEALGENPSLLRSGLHDPAFYQAMWTSLANERRWHGEIWNRRKSGEVYAQVLTITALLDARGEVQNHVAVFSDITSQKEHQKQLERIAHFDGLTSLPNRSLLSDRLQQALSQAQRRFTQVGVVFLDLDGFKTVNDTHGHDAGDQLLQEISHRMESVLRDGDTLARVGGDEFVAVLVDIQMGADCERVLQRLLEAAASPVHRGDDVLQVSASLGVALYPRDATEPDLLLRQADQAMYQAKRQGKNRYHFFDASDDVAARERQLLQADISQALAGQQFELHFQPQVNMRKGSVVGAEALIRWNHPDGRVRNPGAFLPAIEGTPLLVQLDRWVLAEALRHLEDWVTQGINFPVSVNVSAHHLQQPDFLDELRRLLAQHPSVPARLLGLEVLETSALQDMDGVAAVIRECAALGIRFALDDFGTGYSSLTYLKRLPAQELKIDQSFVRDMLTDPEDLTIVEGVISLAQAFGRSVVAEGVETTAHGNLLLRLGCDQAQGYGVAKPMPGARFLAWCQGWTPPTSWLAQQDEVPSRKDLPLVALEVAHRSWLEQVLAPLSPTAAPDVTPPAAQSLVFEQALVQHTLQAPAAEAPHWAELGRLAAHMEALADQLLDAQRQNRPDLEADALLALNESSEAFVHRLYHPAASDGGETSD